MRSVGGGSQPNKPAWALAVKDGVAMPLNVRPQRTILTGGRLGTLACRSQSVIFEFQG